MKPRDFLNFFKTGSGKLVLFVVIFGGGLILFSVGLGLIYLPAGLIGAGVVIMAVALFGPKGQVRQ